MNETTFLVIRDNLQSCLQLDVFSEAFNFDMDNFNHQRVSELIETRLLSNFAS